MSWAYPVGPLRIRLARIATPRYCDEIIKLKSISEPILLVNENVGPKIILINITKELLEIKERIVTRKMMFTVLVTFNMR